MNARRSVSSGAGRHSEAKPAAPAIHTAGAAFLPPKPAARMRRWLAAPEPLQLARWTEVADLYEVLPPRARAVVDAGRRRALAPVRFAAERQIAAGTRAEAIEDLRRRRSAQRFFSALRARLGDEA